MGKIPNLSFTLFHLRLCPLSTIMAGLYISNQFVRRLWKRLPSCPKFGQPYKNLRCSHKNTAPVILILFANFY